MLNVQAPKGRTAYSLTCIPWHTRNMPMRGTAIFLASGVAVLMTQVCAPMSHGLYGSSFPQSGFGPGNSVSANGRHTI